MFLSEKQIKDYQKDGISLKTGDLMRRIGFLKFIKKIIKFSQNFKINFL